MLIEPFEPVSTRGWFVHPYLQDNMEKLIEVITQKRKQGMQVQQAFQQKMVAMEAAQAKANEVGA